MRGQEIRFVVFVVGGISLVIQRLRVTETVRQSRRARHVVAQGMETEIEAALVHGEFKLYHGPTPPPKGVQARRGAQEVSEHVLGVGRFLMACSSRL